MLTLLLRQTTGHREHPSVQQQQMHPQKSHFTLTGSVFRSTELTLWSVSLNSSGATFPVSADGNSISNLLLNPNLKTNKVIREWIITKRGILTKTKSDTYTVTFPAPRMATGSRRGSLECGIKSTHSPLSEWRPRGPSSWTVEIAFKSSVMLVIVRRTWPKRWNS